MLVSSVRVVGGARGGLAARGGHRVELAPDPPPRERGIGGERQAFADEVVDYGEDGKTPTVAQLIMQEIQRPALIRALRQPQRCPVPSPACDRRAGGPGAATRHRAGAASGGSL
jgi:hypothetical protein